MPRTASSSNANLGIRLEGSQSYYAPGDIIKGYVYRKQHIVSPRASVTITLHGRTKSKMVVSRGNSTSVYRGRFNLLSASGYTLRVFDGPIHIPAEGKEHAWPFSFTIPTYVGNMSMAANVYSADYSFLPLNPEFVAEHELPDTFAIQTYGFHTQMQGFVEYFLQADMRATEHGSTDSHEATLPFNLRALSSRPPIVDFHLQKIKQSYSIISYRLVPGMEDAELTFSQKTRQLFNSTKVPTLKFTYQIDLPTVIQLENPNHVPIIIRAAPNWTSTTDTIRDVQQTARLKSLSLKIITTTRIRCGGVFSPHDSDTNEKVDLEIDSAINALDGPIFIPITDDMPPIDIGEMINLRIGHHGRIGMGYSPRRLQPSFTTYNIRHTHQLRWAICADIAGENFKTSGSHRITLVKPSDVGTKTTTRISGSAEADANQSWIRPPEDEIAPPSFTQVQEEDAMLAVLSVNDSKKKV